MCDTAAVIARQDSCGGEPRVALACGLMWLIPLYTKTPHLLSTASLFHTVRGFIQVRYSTIQVDTQPSESGTGTTDIATGAGLAQPESSALVAHPTHHICSHENTQSDLLSYSKACAKRL